MSTDRNLFIAKAHKFNCDFMYVTMKFEGYIGSIMEAALKRGLAKTKAEALRLGLLELNDKYHLISTNLSEDEEDICELARIEQDVNQGKERIDKAKSVKELFE